MHHPWQYAHFLFFEYRHATQKTQKRWAGFRAGRVIMMMVIVMMMVMILMVMTMMMVMVMMMMMMMMVMVMMYDMLISCFCFVLF